MDPEQNPNPDNANSPAAPATQPSNGAPEITPAIQAMIDAAKAEAAQQAKNAAWAEARRTFEGKQKASGGQQPQQPTNNPAPQPAPQGAVPDVAAMVDRILSFERTADAYGLNASARQILKADFNAANPPDPAAWLQQRADAFGWKPAGQTATPNPNAAPASMPAGTPAAPPPAQPPGSPPARVITADTPIVALSREDQAKLAKQLGPFEFKKRLLSQLAESGQRFRLNR